MKKLMLFVIIAVAILTAQDVYRLNDSTFVYPCIVSDSTTSLNFVGLPLETGWTKASDLDPTGINIESVTRWDVVNQGCETGVYNSVFGWCKDFPVQTGGAYMINAKNNFDFTVIGDSVDVAYDLIIADGTDLNCIVHPLTEAQITTTEELGNDFGTAYCNSISKWNNANQSWQTTARFISYWTPVYFTEPATPLMINMIQNLTWPSDKECEGDTITDENLLLEKNTKGNTSKARIVFFHLTESSGRELTEDEMKLIQFEAFIAARPAEILDENGYDCGFTHINGMSVLYVNIGNYITPWTAGEQLNINSVNFSPMQGFMINFDLDNSSSAIFYGFEDQIPGSGSPWAVDMDAVIPLTGVDVSVREESGSIFLEWGMAGGDVTGYNIYASDEPYGTFEYLTTTTSLSWSTPASQDKKFFYVASTNAKSSEPPKTIEINEKR
jgi:hypothetical protein